MDLIRLFVFIGCVLAALLLFLALLYRERVKRRVTYIFTGYHEKSLHRPYY